MAMRGPKFNIATFTFTSVFVIIFSEPTKSESTDFYVQPNFLNHVFELSLREHYDFFFYKNDTVLLNFSQSVISQIGPDFITSPLITTLNLSNNYIQTIAKDAFRNLPNLTSLFLSNNNFTSKNMFSFGNHTNLKVLVMNNFTRKDLSDTTYIETTYIEKYPNLEILSLRDNDIVELRYISSKAQCGPYAMYCLQTSSLAKLTFLDLSGNRLRTTQFMEALSDTLLYLDLNRNKIYSFRSFKAGENLVLLNLDNNDLVTIESYNNLKSLSYFSVSNNYISYLQPDAFKYTPRLIYLNLTRNEIRYLYSEPFATLQFLHTLDLSYNLLENVPKMSNKIHILSLRHNAIREIALNAFAQMPNLTKLLLGGNRIDLINDKGFADLSALEELDLSENQLQYLPEGWSDTLMSLRYLDLSGNNFTSLELVSLASTIPLTELSLATNPLEYLNVRYFENLPQNLTVHLIENSNFTNRWLQANPDFRYYFSWLRMILK